MEMDERGQQLLIKVQELVDRTLGGINFTGGTGVTVAGHYPSWIVTGTSSTSEDVSLKKVTVCHLGSPAQRYISAEAATELGV